MLNNLLDYFEKKFGKYESLQETLAVSKADWKELTGLSYLPIGKAIEISGKPSSGKTTFVLDLLSSLTTVDTILYIDLDYALDSEYCEKLASNKNIIVVSSNDLTKITQIINEYFANYQNPVIILDSLASAKYKNMLYLEVEIANLIHTVQNQNGCLLVLNQLRTNIREHKVKSFGSNKLKQSYAIRIHIDKIYEDKEKKYCTIKTIKNSYILPKTIEKYELQ